MGLRQLNKISTKPGGLVGFVVSSASMVVINDVTTAATVDVTLVK